MSKIIDKILNLLVKGELTSVEIAEQLQRPLKNITVYMNTLFKDGRVERIDNKIPYSYRANTPKAYLKRLYNFMSDEKKCSLKNINQDDIDFLEKIEEMIE